MRQMTLNKNKTISILGDECADNYLTSAKIVLSLCSVQGVSFLFEQAF